MLWFLLALLSLLLTSLQHGASASEGQFAFNGFAGANLTLDGATAVSPNGLLVLTNGTVASTGHALHPMPQRFREPSNGTVRSFSTTFVFAIVSPHLSLSSHGMAFIVSPTRRLSNTMPFQYLGLLNTTDGNGSAGNHIFAVELDTLRNFDLGDIDGNHVGIDVNSLRSVTSASAGYYYDDHDASLFQNLSLFSREAMQTWVDYNAQDMELQVAVAPLGAPKPKKPLLSHTIDLSTVVTDEEAYVGFSSSTGLLSCSHYVLGWSFSIDGSLPALDVSRLPKFPNPFGAKRPGRFNVLPIVLPTVVTIALVASVLVFLSRRMAYYELREDWEAEFMSLRVSYKDLMIATKNFGHKQLIGKGGSGEVYKGILPGSKIEVAVKRVSHESQSGMKAFLSEVASIGRLRHRNLVHLLGYCRTKRDLLLVYEYMPNGSLDTYLYSQARFALSWVTRFHIVKCIASGLLYLHEEWEKVVVHRDIKASNILLDREMNSKLGDFGLARLYERGSNPYTTYVVGTMGYLAPELLCTGRATPATDVFSFGVFLLEIACGRRSIEVDSMNDEETFTLVNYVLEHCRNRSLVNVIDPRLRGDYDAAEAYLILKLGLLCSHPVSTVRPGMRQVVQYLNGDLLIPEM
ncbi:L-type lectin-domain containing receptor kinase IV.2 [Dichanthelium oligosanthes]|uniref:L-type lectin-domain containing receptor kinase IV.2 n=1 Tax=Dichanthelium oligosanthes TaxID=888268 RepID=A0A1E5UII1_9POAL|nr:L-type lectin-domain containing receptor kinase IV.2 [Dichanthelium oligosanthes]